jgi:hypothetical protein
MATWEYKVVKQDDSDKLEEELNKLGKQGWEVVAGGIGVSSYGLYSRFVLKRIRHDD